MKSKTKSNACEELLRQYGMKPVKISKVRRAKLQKTLRVLEAYGRAFNRRMGEGE